MTANKGFSGAEYAEAFARLGNKTAVAREFGVDESVVRKALKRYEARQNLEPGIAAALERTGISPENARFGYRRIKDEDGSFNTVFWRMPDAEIETLADRVRAAMEGIHALEPIAAPEYCEADLLTLYPLADRHNGLMAWAKETGQAYDTKIAVQRLQSWIGNVVSSSPRSHTAIILDVGDGTHADDQKNMTPTSGHILDVDTRHFRTMDMEISGLAAAVELAAQHHARVIVRILPGNHNPTSYMTTLFALRERYRNSPQIEVQAVPGEWFVYEFGKVMIAAHHGHRAKADRMTHFIADEYADIWGRTRHRFLFTGHLHHHKSQDIGGVQWEQLRAMSERDAYAVSHAYTARAQLQAITYHKMRGEVSRVKVTA